MDTGNWLTIVMWVAGVAAMAGMTVSTQKGLKKDISRLEAKVDRHNSFMERLAVVETKVSNIEKGE